MFYQLFNKDSVGFCVVMPASCCFTDECQNPQADVMGWLQAMGRKSLGEKQRNKIDWLLSKQPFDGGIGDKRRGGERVT